MLSISELEAGEVYLVIKGMKNHFTKEETWYDALHRFTGKCNEYAYKMFRSVQIGKLPIMEDAAGYVHIPNETHKFYIFPMKAIKGQEIEVNGVMHRFVDFYIHHDSETDKPKDFLYHLENVKTQETLYLKPFEAVTKKYDYLIHHLYFEDGRFAKQVSK